MLKKFVAFFLLACIVFLTPSAFALGKPSKWAEPEIAKAEKYGLVPHDPPFNYQDNITREEFCEIAMNLYHKIAGKELPGPKNCVFKDTCNPSVCEAYALGIMNGTGQDTFSPKEYVTKEQAAAILYRVLEAANKPVLQALAEEKEENYVHIFFDNYKSAYDEFDEAVYLLNVGEDISPWAIKPFVFMFDNGVIQGNRNGPISIRQYLTAEQALALAVRTFERFNMLFDRESTVLVKPNKLGFKVYKSSNFEKNYIEIKICDFNNLKVSGFTLLKGDYLQFLIYKETHDNMSINSDEILFDEAFDINSNGSFAGDVAVDLPEGEYSIYATIISSNDSPKAMCSILPLCKENGKLFFPVSPVYKRNMSAFVKNPYPTSSDLSLDRLSEEDKQKLCNLAKNITQGKSDDFQKVLAICDWVSENIYYDHNTDPYNSRLKTDAVSVLQTRYTICQGYAELAAALAKAVGIPAKVVSGVSLGGSASGRTWTEMGSIVSSIYGHVWNEFFVDGRWVVVDPTWNSENIYSNGHYEYNGRHYAYFDPTIQSLSYTHAYKNLPKISFEFIGK